jgi:hypothetical protein
MRDQGFQPGRTQFAEHSLINLSLSLGLSLVCGLAVVKQLTGLVQQVPLPVVDHRGMKVLLTGQLSGGLLPSNRFNRHLGFELRTVLLAFSAHELLLSLLEWFRA